MKLSALLLVALLLLINVEVFGRYLFNYSTLVADEYGGYLYAWIVLLGGVHLLRSDRYLTMTGSALAPDSPRRRSSPTHRLQCRSATRCCVWRISRS